MIESMTYKIATPDPDRELRDIAGYTAQIRVLEEQRAALAEKRRLAIVRHHNEGVRIATMARAMNISEAAVNKLLKSGPSAKAARRGAVNA